MHSIDDVITVLDDIIAECAVNNDPLGYFAVLYQRVTRQVKEGIEAGFFDDGERMERLDVVFAKRYIDAYRAYRRGEPTTLSWAGAFDLGRQSRPIVLQHLLTGINAHINLDLGIAAAEVAKTGHIDELEGDFNRINEILSALVDEIQQNLCRIWPTLTWILQKTRQIDNCIVDFSMKLARDGAWQFAQQMSVAEPEAYNTYLTEQDRKVAAKAKIINRPGWLVVLALWIIRLGERGHVAARIEKLKAVEEASVKASP